MQLAIVDRTPQELPDRHQHGDDDEQEQGHHQQEVAAPGDQPPQADPSRQGLLISPARP